MLKAIVAWWRRGDCPHVVLEPKRMWHVCGRDDEEIVRRLLELVCAEKATTWA